MSGDWIVNVAGAALIAAIVWWFWIARPRVVKAQSDLVEIVVANGVYTPARIEAHAGTPITLRFLREDPSPCAEQVVFDTLGVSAELPLGEAREVTVTPPAAGEYDFTCQMQMYRGTLVVK
ncbi:MAG: cupredoxin domain-containing protein [Pseudomonadota bacterium]|nr:MAG: cupredoxin domain-containing protein [Pseudomonadota bacterium]